MTRLYMKFRVCSAESSVPRYVRQGLSLVQLSHSGGGCHQAKGVFDDLDDLVPIHCGMVEKHAEPVRKCPSCRGRRLEEPCGFTRDERFLRTRRGRAPKRHSIVVVVVVEVAERPLVSNEEADCPVAQSFCYVRQRKRDGPNPIEFKRCHGHKGRAPSTLRRDARMWSRISS